MHSLKTVRKSPEKFFEDMKRRGYTDNIEEKIALFKDSDKEDIELMKKQKALLSELPNVPAPEVPETQKIIGHYGEEYLRPAKEGDKKHYEFPAIQWGIKAGAKISGSKYIVLPNKVAELERIIQNTMVDIAIKNGYTLISHPCIVREEAMYGSGQLPKFAEDAFTVTGGKYLVPTSEVPLINLAAGQILEAHPYRSVAVSPCFRAEAGAAGKQDKGLLRSHQFNKVELVSIVDAETAKSELDRLVKSAEDVLKALELPYRKVLLGASDMGFAARKTYDLEVYFPVEKRYIEVSSCSDCGQFQARRSCIKYIDSQGKKQFAYTFNASALAVGRVLAAVMETHQESYGAFII